jgi:hypothetical protein
MDVPAYVGQLLDEWERRDAAVGSGALVQADATRHLLADTNLSVLDSPEAVAAWIQAHGPTTLPVQEPTDDLAELRRTGGVDPGISPEEWDRRWAAYEAPEKELDLANSQVSWGSRSKSTSDQ